MMNYTSHKELSLFQPIFKFFCTFVPQFIGLFDDNDKKRVLLIYYKKRQPKKMDSCLKTFHFFTYDKQLHAYFLDISCDFFPKIEDFEVSQKSSFLTLRIFSFFYENQNDFSSTINFMIILLENFYKQQTKGLFNFSR